MLPRARGWDADLLTPDLDQRPRFLRITRAVAGELASHDDVVRVALSIQPPLDLDDADARSRPSHARSRAVV
jgi:hypothetical protein